MDQISIFSSYIPEISGVVFDMQDSIGLRTSTKLASYALDTGYVITNGVIQEPTTMRMTVGIGDRPLKSLLTDPVGAISSDPLSILGGALSNFTDSGLANYAFGLASTNLFKGESRGGIALAALQAIQLTAKPFEVVVFGTGTVKGLLIQSIDFNQRASTGNASFYDVVMQQIQSQETARTIDTAQDEVDMGESNVTEVFD